MFERSIPVPRVALRLGIAAVCVTGAIALIVATHDGTDPAPYYPACDGFDFPVGAPDAVGYYDAQPFGTNTHLGSDWNGNGGTDTDFGDPIYAASSGVVVDATDYAGDWGNVVRIQHPCGIETLYAHLDTVGVVVGAPVKRGQIIGTMGDAHGRYLAHLHFELRDKQLPLGGGYSEWHNGYLDPTAYIRRHRPKIPRTMAWRRP